MRNTATLTPTSILGDTALWSRLLLLVGLLLLWWGFFAPWVPHTAAALRITGYDLAEWMTFIPAVRDGQVGTGRVPQLVPLAALVVATMAVAWQRHGWVRVFWLAVAALGVVSLLPGYPFILDFRTDGVILRMIVQGVVALLIGGASYLLLLLPLRWRGVPVAVVVAVGFFAAWRSFLALRPVVSELYGAGIAPGGGLWLYSAGAIAAFVALLLPLRTSPLPPATDA